MESDIEAVLGTFVALGAEVLEPAVNLIDTELVRELLQLGGRGRAAAAAVRATRWRGAGVAVELPDEAFAEAVLFPLPEVIDRVVPTRAGAAPSAIVLQVVRTLADCPVTVERLTAAELIAALDSPLAPGVREAWEALAKVHSGADARLEDSVEGDAL